MNREASELTVRYTLKEGIRKRFSTIFFPSSTAGEAFEKSLSRENKATEINSSCWRGQRGRSDSMHRPQRIHGFPDPNFARIAWAMRKYAALVNVSSAVTASGYTRSHLFPFHATVASVMFHT